MDGLQVKIKMTDGVEHNFPLRPRIIVDFEQKFNKGMGKLFGEDQKLEHLYYLGWATLRANGVVVKPFGADFLDTISSVELVQDPSSASTEIA